MLTPMRIVREYATFAVAQGCAIYVLGFWAAVFAAVLLVVITGCNISLWRMQGEMRLAAAEGFVTGQPVMWTSKFWVRECIYIEPAYTGHSVMLPGMTYPLHPKVGELQPAKVVMNG